MMSSSTSLTNKLVLNKYLWMAHQLRHFNDVGSIINWSNAMQLVKGLLFEPVPVAATQVKTTSSTVTHQPSQYPFSIVTPNIAAIKIPPVPLNTNATRLITPPTTIGFEPIKTMPLTQSPLSCSNYIPREPSPLTTYTHCQHTISPTDSLPRRPKRRKLANPPTVDYHASADVPQHTSIISATSPSYYSLRPGTLILHSRNHWTKTPTDGSDKFEVLKVPPDWNFPYSLRNVETGEDYDMIFCKEMVKFLFPA